MRIAKALMAAAVLVAMSASTAFAVDLLGEAQKVVAGLEKMSGRPIAILTRVDTDPGVFWYKAMQVLCAKTGDNWCDDQLSTVLTDTTNQMGWARVLTYKDKTGKVKTVCAMLPPRPGLDAGYAATALAGQVTISWDGLPTNDEMGAYLWLMHAASCLNEAGNNLEEIRADVFATLALTLIEGDWQFVGNYAVSPSRLFNPIRHPDQTRWATNVGERLLLELWKQQTADRLGKIPCNVTVTASQDLNTDYITRDASLPAGQDCTNASPGGYLTGTVTDQNLWIWTGNFGGATFAMPPKPYIPFMMFDTYDEAITYMWGTSNQLAGITY